MRIAVCIEENPADDFFAAFMQGLCKKIMSGMEICRYRNKRDFLKGLSAQSFDLVYLNIAGGIKDACDILLKLRTIDKTVPVFFATGYWKYVERLCDTEPVVFIRKPLDGKVFRSVSCVQNTEEPAGNYFFEYDFRKKTYRIRISEILYFESTGRNIVIHLDRGKQERFIGQLDEVEKKLHENGQTFVRSHQSYLIRYMAIKKYNSDRLFLKNNEVLPVSQNRKTGFLDAVSQISQIT